MPFEVSCDDHPDFESTVPVDAYVHAWREHQTRAPKDLQGTIHVRFKMQVEAQDNDRTLITHCRRCAARIVRHVPAGAHEGWHLPVCDNCITQEFP